MEFEDPNLVDVGLFGLTRFKPPLPSKNTGMSMPTLGVLFYAKDATFKGGWSGGLFFEGPSFIKETQ